MGVVYFASLTGKEIEGLKKLPRSQPVNFCPMYKSNDVVSSVMKNFDYVVFDSLGFLFNKFHWRFLSFRKKYKVSNIKHVLKYCFKILCFQPNEVTMFDLHGSILRTILYSIPIYLCSLFKFIPFNIVVWNKQTYFLFKKIFFFYRGVSIASGWDDINFIQTVITNEKFIHCFGIDGKSTAVKYSLRYDSFEWIKTNS